METKQTKEIVSEVVGLYEFYRALHELYSRVVSSNQSWPRLAYVIDLDQHFVGAHVHFRSVGQNLEVHVLIFDTLEVDFEAYRLAGLLFTKNERERIENHSNSANGTVSSSGDNITNKFHKNLRVQFMSPVCDYQRLSYVQEQEIIASTAEKITVYYDRCGQPYRKIIVQPVLQAERDNTCKSRTLAVLLWMLGSDLRELNDYLVKYSERFDAEIIEDPRTNQEKRNTREQRQHSSFLYKADKHPRSSAYQQGSIHEYYRSRGLASHCEKDKFGRRFYTKVCHENLTAKYNEKLEVQYTVPSVSSDSKPEKSGTSESTLAQKRQDEIRRTKDVILHGRGIKHEYKEENSAPKRFRNGNNGANSSGNSTDGCGSKKSTDADMEPVDPNDIVLRSAILTSIDPNPVVAQSPDMIMKPRNDTMVDSNNQTPRMGTNLRIDTSQDPIIENGNSGIQSPPVGSPSSVLSRTCSVVRNSRSDDFESLLQRWRYIETDEERWKFLEETCWFEHNRGFKKIKKYPAASILEHFDCPDVKNTFEGIEYLRKYRQKKSGLITHEADSVYHGPIEMFLGFLCYWEWINTRGEWNDNCKAESSSKRDPSSMRDQIEHISCDIVAFPSFFKDLRLRDFLENESLQQGVDPEEGLTHSSNSEETNESPAAMPSYLKNLNWNVVMDAIPCALRVEEFLDHRMNRVSDFLLALPFTNKPQEYASTSTLKAVKMPEKVS